MTNFKFAEYLLLLVFIAFVFAAGIALGVIHHPKIDGSFDGFIQSIINLLYKAKNIA
jgi:hypothetical protein